MSQTVMNSTPILTLTSFAGLNWIVAPLRSGDVISDEWRGGPFWLEVLEGNLGRGDLPLGLFLYFLGGYPSGRKAKKLLEPIQGPKPRLIEKKLAVVRLAEVKRPEPGELIPVPLANVERVLVGASTPGELAQGLGVRMGGSFACFPLPEGSGVKIIKARGIRGMQWGHEAPKVQQVWEVEGSGYSLPLWRGRHARAGIALAEERGLPSAPKEVRLLLAAAPADCGTEPRKLIAWAQQEKARLTAEKQATRATKKGARGTGLSAGPEPLTKGELYRAVRWLARQVRACRLEKKAKERAAKMAARERQHLLEQAEKMLWASAIGCKEKASGQTSVGRVWTGNRKRERIHA